MFNQSFNNMKGKTTFLAKAFLMLIAVLFSLTGAKAQETLTVYDGTDQSNTVPAYMYYFDDFTKSQVVFPAESLEAIGNGGVISALTFYTDQTAAYTSVSVADVFLKEVDYTAISAYEAKEGIVYSGILTVAADGSLTIEFTTPYTYGGGNLLLGIENTTDAGYKNVKFYGQAVDGASVAGFNASSLDAVSPSAKNFIPKTTFTYIPAGFSGPMKPTGLEVIYDGGTEATVRWTSDEDAFDLEVNGTVIEDVDNGYTLENLEYATTYTVRVRAKKDGEVSDWTSPVTFNTEFGGSTCQIKLVLTDSYGDGWNGNAIKIVDVLTGIEIGTYTLASGSNETFYVEVPDGREIQFQWVSGSYADETSYSAYDVNDDEIFSGSDALADPVNYTVNCTVSPWRAPSDFAASEIGATSVKLSWTENSNPAATSWVIMYMPSTATSDEDIQFAIATTNPYVLEGLTPETTYYAVVSPYIDESTLKLSDEISFTTIEQFVSPTDVAADAFATKATISWEGDNDNYTLRYREIAADAEPLTKDFEDSSLGEWTTIDADGDGYDWVLGTAIAGVYLQDEEGATLAGEGHTGSVQDLIVSGSFSNVVGALTPDNFLVSPKIKLGGNISFWAKGLDSSYSAEVFGVAVSTASNTNPADFVMVGTTKTATADWAQYTFDLSAFSGEGYVAIRHYNITDMFVLCVDDIVITPGGDSEWTVVENATSPYTIEGLTPETEYQVAIQAVYADGVSRWVGTTFTTLSDNPVPFDVVVTPMHNSATIEWKGESDSYEVKYRTPAQPNYLFLEDFESVAGTNALPEGWTSVDRDGDGNNWYTFTPSTINDGSGNPTVFGTTCATSASYNSSALTPDNWLITPQIDLGGTLSMWVRGQDPSWAGEKFTVYISTVTEIADVSTDFVELIPEATASATYVEYTADLSEYAGKKGYIAIRHHDITDMFRLNVDNISIYDGETPAGEWTTITTTETSVELTGLDSDTEYEYMITGITGESSASTEIASFTTLSENDKIFITDGNWDVAENWAPAGVPAASANVIIKANAIIPAGTDAVADEITIDGGSLTIKDGATLVHNNEGVVATVEKEIQAGKYYLVTAPLYLFDGDYAAPLDPADVEGMLTGDYDLYSFDFTKPGEEWRNYKEEPFQMMHGIAYLYANSQDVTLKFTGELEIAPTGINFATYNYTEYTEDDYPFANWNLVGNASVANTYLGIADYDSSNGSLYFIDGEADYYTLNADGDAIVVASGATAPANGMFVISDAGTNIVITCVDELIPNEATEDPVIVLPEHGLTTHQDASPLVVYTLEDMQEGSMNDELLEELDGSIVNLQLADRVLYKDGTWNTICLPFAMDEAQIADSPLAEADIRTLNSVTQEGTLVTLNFTAEGDITTIEAGKPYIIKWAAGGENAVSPLFKDVTIENVSNPIECTVTGAETDASITFKGTYDLYEFYEDDASILFIGEGNKLNYPLAGAKIGACRGYFQLSGISAADDEENGAKQFVLNFGDDATAIATISKQNAEGNWYDISGRKVSKLNQKGIYVTEGRKVTVK